MGEFLGTLQTPTRKIWGVARTLGEFLTTLQTPTRKISGVVRALGEFFLAQLAQIWDQKGKARQKRGADRIGTDPDQVAKGSRDLLGTIWKGAQEA